MRTKEEIKINRPTAKDLMKFRLLSLHPKDTIERANEIFKRYAIHHIPVVVGKKLVGLISQGDILAYQKATIKLDSQFPVTINIVGTRIEDLMTKQLITTTVDTELEQILELLINNRINALPVVDEEKTLLGLITSYDILKFYKNNC